METVDMPFVKALIQNISTDVSEDLLYSLVPSQVKSFLLAGSDLSASAYQSFLSPIRPSCQ